MNTPTPEAINRVLDDQLFRLHERWPREYASLQRNLADGKCRWIAYVNSKGPSPGADTAEAAVDMLLRRDVARLKEKQMSLRAELESIEAELAAQKEKGT